MIRDVLIGPPYLPLTDSSFPESLSQGELTPSRKLARSNQVRQC
ncbi:hypothetical protein O9992_05780 [Vibrio lentus]|nr:hypothetical protein [Vibrio lentus]